jgi:protein-S-isoprenylcysteine O-methyltransferase Ste14
MSLKIELESQGQWLFRWRSFLPVVCLPIIVIALAGIQLPFGSFALHEAWEFVSLGISFLGLILRAFVVGYAARKTSGRNTKGQEAESLNTTGAYSVVRHPLYVGNFLIGLGAALAPFVWWLPLLYSLAFWLYYERIMFAEEAFLHGKFGAEFERWASATPAFVARLYQWRPAALPFSLRTVLRREYTGLMVVILMHGSVELCENLVIEHGIAYESFWILMFVGGGTAYFVLRFLKKHTNVLNTPGILDNPASLHGTGAFEPCFG